MSILDKFFTKKTAIPRANMPINGRSSVNSETINNSLAILSGFYGQNSLSFILPILENAAIYNPDVTHSIRNWINMANTGHKIIVDGGSEPQNQAALEMLNDLAAELYPRSFGIDGLINHYLNQIIIGGAISSEDIISPRGDAVTGIELIPLSQVRFKYETDVPLSSGGVSGWQPYQYANGLEYKLNPFTYHYLAHLLMKDNRPEAKPLIISVIEPLRRQKDMHENIGYIMKKFGLLGFVSMALNPPARERNETLQEYQSRLRLYQDDITASLSDVYRDGMMVHYTDQTLNYQNIGAMSQGSYEIHKLNEEQVFSGIGIDPAMQGRSYSTTETYAGVVYQLTAQEAATLQRMCKRRLERTYNLHLMLQGSPCTAKILFNKIAEKDPKASAERAKLELDTVITKVKSGLITPDQAAQELGYDEWFNEALISQYSAQGGGYQAPFSVRNVGRYVERPSGR